MFFRKRLDESTGEVLSGALGVGTAGGVLTFALFPLVLPIVVLTVVALLPLVVIGLVGGLVVGLVVAPVKLIARLRNRRQPPIETSTVRGWSPSESSIARV
jgi:hypothetical protein